MLKSFKSLRLGKLLRYNKSLFSSLTLGAKNFGGVYVQTQKEDYLLDLRLPGK